MEVRPAAFLNHSGHFSPLPSLLVGHDARIASSSRLVPRKTDSENRQIIFQISYDFSNMTFRPFLSLFLLSLAIPLPVFSEESAAPASTSPGREYREPGAFEVATRLVEWRDESPDRAVPAKLYFPKDAPGPFPVIIFSHGLGGSRDGYGYLGRHWASHGYVSVHLQHLGSDDATWRGVPPLQILESMKEAANVKNFIARPADVRFAIDQLERLDASADDPLAGKLDLAHLGMAGHSFGARTTMAIAGEVYAFPGGDEELSFGDDRVKAAIAMSPMPSRNAADHDTAYREISIPTLHLTGTLDTSPIEKGRTAAERLIPFEKTPGEHHYLVNFEGGDHMIFSGRPRGLRGLLGDPTDDAAFQALIRQGTTAFWDAWLKNSAEARAWLTAETNGFGASLGERADYRWK